MEDDPTEKETANNRDYPADGVQILLIILGYGTMLNEREQETEHQ